MEGAPHDPPTKISQVVPDIGTLPRAFSRPSEKPKSDGPRVEIRAEASPNPPRASVDPPVTSEQPSGRAAQDVWPRPVEPSAPAAEPAPVAASLAPTSSNAGAFSVAELWPDAERDRVRQAEAMLGARDAVNAILACDVLVTRVLASAAGLVGTLDAPRDPALVSLLLGLDGARYLHFRTLVRAARHRESVTMKDALECFTFSIEARRAREALRR